MLMENINRLLTDLFAFYLVNIFGFWLHPALS